MIFQGAHANSPLNELVAGTLIDYPLYMNWETNQLTTPEVIVQQLKEQIEKQGGKQSNQVSPCYPFSSKSSKFSKRYISSKVNLYKKPSKSGGVCFYYY